MLRSTVDQQQLDALGRRMDSLAREWDRFERDDFGPAMRAAGGRWDKVDRALWAKRFRLAEEREKVKVAYDLVLNPMEDDDASE